MLLVFIFLLHSLHDITIVNGEFYYQRSVNNRIKMIETTSKRGEIFDRNGVLLATNQISYNVTLNTGLIPNATFSETAIAIYDFLKSQNEDQLEFPIYIENGVYKYSFDESIKKWLYDNGYDESWTAEEIFNDVRSANYIDPEMSNYEAYRILYNQGKYMPISSARMQFFQDIQKTQFLSGYNLDPDTSAYDAFQSIRNRSNFKIDATYSDEDAYKILVLRHAIKEKGYLKYELLTIAKSVSEETAVLVQEKGFMLPGLAIEYETIRYYPYASTAAHILGYMGSISSESEVEYYVNTQGYNPNQMIGKTGIEASFEDILHGENGYKYIEVDVYGKYVADVDETAYDGLDAKRAIAGDDVYLSIELGLQQVLENSLEKALDMIRVGGVYDSPWGDFQYQAFPNVETAAGVVIDVNTGEVLAMASYPSYDVNLFSRGISQEDWNALNPVNKRNPLAARPLYNIATMMAVQPGSVYKMMTGYAAMEQGLDPYKQYYADGFIEIGNQRFGCWLYNQYGLRHGMTDFFKALEVSCNYYFFNIANGKDYYRNASMNFTMSPMLMTKSSEKFGLHEKTGIEISEVSLGVPEPDKKKRTIQALLSQQLNAVLKDYYPESIVGDEDKLTEMVQTIVGWSDENPSRGVIISRLMDMGPKGDYTQIEKLADLIKYDYFNLMKWYESDTMNLAIGQGDHTYTPIQIGRYVATIANGGYLNPLTLIRTDGQVNQGEFIDEQDLLKHVQQGMYQVTHGNPTNITRIFQNLPIKIGSKTGTAQKEGLIPPLDEVAYLTEYLKEFAPKLTLEAVEEKTLDIIKSRSEELATLEREMNEATDPEEREKKSNRLNQLIDRDYLNKGSAMRVAIKELSNYTITDDDINRFRLPYDNYSWFVAYAPYDAPEIAVVVMIPQGGHGAYSAPVVRDVIAEYFQLEPPEKSNP